MCSDCTNHVSEKSLAKDAGYEPPIAVRGTYDDPRFADQPMTAPQREVPYALMMQDQANDRLAKAVEILHDRTAGLRHSGMERAEDGDRAVRDYGSETARLIGDQANRTDMAARVIEKILTEMEI